MAVQNFLFGTRELFGLRENNFFRNALHVPPLGDVRARVCVPLDMRRRRCRESQRGVSRCVVRCISQAGRDSNVRDHDSDARPHPGDVGHFPRGAGRSGGARGAAPQPHGALRAVGAAVVAQPST